MKHTRIISFLAAAGAAAICTLASVSADDKEAAAQPPTPTINDQEYRLGPGDKLRIEIYKDPQLSQSVQVRPDGKITLPLIGDLDATGRTPIELRDLLATS